MTNAHEAVKTRHKETSLIFPVLALVVLFLWGSAQTLPVVIAINLLALIGILSSAFSVVRHADVLAHRPVNLMVLLFLAFPWLFLKSV